MSERCRHDIIEDCPDCLRAEIESLRSQLVNAEKALRSPQMQAVAQQAIMKHTFYNGGPVHAYGFAGAALKAVADAFIDENKNQ